MEVLTVKPPDKDWKKSQKPPENQTPNQTKRQLPYVTKSDLVISAVMETVSGVFTRALYIYIYINKI